MSCCECCCVAKTPPGVCCPDECCQEPRICCGEGESAVCCDEGQICVDGVCTDVPPCDPPCEEGQNCCDGVCQDGPCGPQPPQQYCCCDAAGFRVLQANEECASGRFPVPNPPKSVSVVFEWCGLTGVEAFQGQASTYFADAVIGGVVCDTTGRYGADPSYTQATRKALSVTILSGGGGGTCGYQRRFIVSVGNEGVGFKRIGEDYYAWENVITSENYDCEVSVCFDGSEEVVTMVLFGNTTDDTCGGSGNFDPCKFETPEVTVVVAP